VLGLFLPGLWAAESILQERERGTLESLLLTPVDRQRVIWAKLLARIRPLAAMAACCPVVGLVFGLVWGRDLLPGEWYDAKALFVAGAGGLAAGLLVGAEVLGFGFTAGALGIAAALRGRGRVAVLVRALFYAAAMLLVDAVMLAGVLFPGVILVLVPTSCLLLICKLLFFNWRLGTGLIDRSADLMDPLLLAGEG
jgi:ABC-type Na+ efflux pump permease subunit